MDIFEGFLGVLTVYGLWILLISIFVFAFIIWLIKKGVKNAIVEILDDEQYIKDLKYTIAEGVLLALEQYNNGNQKKDVDE